MNKSYYIESPWDSQWISADNKVIEYITEHQLQPTETLEDHSIYEFNIGENRYYVVNAEYSYITKINRLTEFTCSVQVKIDDQYVLARPHQKEALIKYVMTGEPEITVPHTCRGDFKATFSTVGRDNFEYITEDGIVMQLRRVALL